MTLFQTCPERKSYHGSKNNRPGNGTRRGGKSVMWIPAIASALMLGPGGVLFGAGGFVVILTTCGVGRALVGQAREAGGASLWRSTRRPTRPSCLR